MKKQITSLFVLALMVLPGCGQPPVDSTKTANTSAASTRDAQENSTKAVKVPTARNNAFKTSFSLANDRPELKVGEEFNVVVRVSKLQKPVTTVTAYLHFDPALVEASTVSFKDSVFPTVFRNKVDNTAGQVEMSASSAVGQSGVTGDQNFYAEIRFKAKQKGKATISFNTDKTAVLLEDNTDVKPAEFPSLNVEIQ